MEPVARFEAELRVEGKTATYVEVPPEAVTALGGKRVPVVARINGATVRTTVFTYGEQSVIPVNRGFRAAAGVTAGEIVAVELEADDAPRTVAVPDDLARGLAGAAPAAREAWEALSFTGRRECVEWLASARRAETRARRLAQALERLAARKPPR